MKSLLYETVRKSIESRIDNGIYEPGDKLPTEEFMCKEFKVSRITIRKALNMLCESGVIVKIRGNGTFVRDHHSKMYKYRLDSFAEENISSEYTNEVTKFSLMIAPDNITKSLNLSKNDYVYHAERIRYMEGNPIQIEQCWMPKSIFPNLSIQFLERSKYHYIENICGYEIERDEQTLYPILPRKAIAKTLGISRNKPILKISSVGFLTDGRAFEVSEVYFNAKGYDVTIVATR